MATDPTYKDLYRIKDAVNNVIYQIRAMSLAEAITIALSGDVSGSAFTDFHENVTINATIANGAVTHAKLAADSVQNDVIKDNTIEMAKFNASVYNEVAGTIADGTNANLATKTQVKAYVESVISSEGHYKGVQSVATINSWPASSLHNGDRVITSSDPEGSGTGTLTLGNLPVVDGQEVIFYVSDDQSVKIWQSSEGNYKIKQSAKTDPTASGTTIAAIDSITQNTNGEITATKKTIRSATTEQTGIVQLAGSIGATVATENNKAASEKAVRDAINALNATVTSTDGTNVQVKVTETAGKITAVNITTDNTENKNNKVTAWSASPNDVHYPSEQLVKASLDGKVDKVTTATAGDFAAFDANGNIVDSGHKHSDYKTKQTAVTDPTASGNAISFISSYTQNANGESTVEKKTVPNVAASTAGAGGTNGLMLATDKEKLNGIASGATKVEGSGTNGNIKINGVETTVYTHPTNGANTSKGDTTAQTPGFGDTFKALSATVDSMGHTTALADHTVKIPDAVATPSTSGAGGTKGLMSAADKEKLDGLDSGAELKNKEEVIAAALDNHDARLGAMEAILSDTNIGTRTADELDAQVLKVAGEDVAEALASKVKSVKVGSSSATELNSNGNVVIPLAVPTGTTGAKDGAMSAADKKALDDLKAGAVTDVKYVANSSGGGGALKKTVNGTDSTIIEFMTTAEAQQLWADAKAAALAS